MKRIETLAAEKKVSPAQLALAWVLSRPEGIVPLFGTKRRVYLEENLRTLEVRLSPSELAAIDQIAPKGVAAGTRYGEAGMKAVNR